MREVVLRALWGTPAKIKERESKESQVEKKNKEMRELEREDYLFVVSLELYCVVFIGGELEWKRKEALMVVKRGGLHY